MAYRHQKIVDKIVEFDYNMYTLSEAFLDMEDEKDEEISNLNEEIDKLNQEIQELQRTE